MTRTVGQLLIEDEAIGVPGAANRTITGTPEAVFAHVRLGDDGRYRPLSGAATLPTGWSAPLGPAFDADIAIETVYPLALTHQRQFAAGTLRVVPLEDVLARQSGRYESSAVLSEEGRARAAGVVCGACVRHPVWNGAACAPEGIPCPEACSVLVAFCREAASWQASPPPPEPPDPRIPWAAFEEPGNELRERYLQEMAEAYE